MKTPRIIVLALAVFTMFCLTRISGNLLYAKDIDNTSETCVDLLLVFARGSSQNQNQLFLDFPYGDDFKNLEKESGRFFETFKEHLDRDYPHVSYKAHSIHDFPGKYNEIGYRAVPIFQIVPPNFNNALNAEMSWWSGDYRNSVGNGIHETIGFIKEQIEQCPDQRVVMGGYSQGAHVVGESLFHFTETELAKIEGVALFGDPKFVAADYDPWNPFSDPKTYPWKRGTASDKERGSADARIPYVPTGMENKVYSWCFDDDFVCAGASGLRKNIAEGHKRYSYFGVQQAAVEIIQTMSPQLYAIERTKGGIDKSAGPMQVIPHTPNLNPIDFMFLVNTSYNMNDVLWQLRLATPQVMPPLGKFFFETRFAAADFREIVSGGGFQPILNLAQDFRAFENSTPNNLEWNFVRKLAGGNLSGGGGDSPDPHILAVERMSMLPSWRPEAIKHIVLITDRPMKEMYTYNVCNNIVRTGFGLPTPSNCITSPGLEEASANYHPELCDTVWQVLAQSNCRIGMTSPGATHNITRTMEDAIHIAQTKNIAVTIVVPHTIPHPVNKETAEERLEHFAKATGGLFIKYDVFNQASYSDMMWQILNHQPQQMKLAYKDALKTLGENEKLEPVTHVLAKINVPTILDVSQGTKTSSTYRWDFDSDGSWDAESQSPTIEHIFDQSIEHGFLSVAGLDNEGRQETELNLPLTVEPYDGRNIPVFESLELPENINAILKDGTVSVSWENRQPRTVMMVADPDTGAPLFSAPAENEKLNFGFEGSFGDGIVVWILGENGSSPRQIVALEEADEDNEKVLAASESNPWGQYVETSTGHVASQVTLTSSNGGQGNETDLTAVAGVADMTEGAALSGIDLESQQSSIRPDRTLILILIGGAGAVLLFLVRRKQGKRI